MSVGLAYFLAGNIVNYIIVISTLSGMLGWPDEIVFWQSDSRHVHRPYGGRNLLCVYGA